MSDSSKRVHLQYDGEETLVSIDGDGNRLKVVPGSDFEVDAVTAEILRSAPGIAPHSERRATGATSSSAGSTASSKPTDQ